MLFSSNFSTTNISSKQEITTLFGNTLKIHNYDNKEIYQLTNKGKEIYCKFISLDTRHCSLEIRRWMNHTRG